jgi:hypothetical protein
MTQFYKMTLEAAISHYRNGDITAKGLLRFWLRIQLAEGWSINVNPTQLRKLLGMKPSTFWAALTKLKEGGEMAWEEPTSMKITRLKPEAKNSLPKESSQIMDATLENETLVSESRHSSQIVEDRGLEANESNGSSSVLDSYQTFIKSLSQMEREEFLGFCRRKVRELPKKVVLFDSWMSKHFQELWAIAYRRVKSMSCIQLWCRG